MKQIGLLIMAYGGPNNIDEVEPYLLDVRGYRPTAPEIIHEVRERYDEIGGRFPILLRNRGPGPAPPAPVKANSPQLKNLLGNAPRPPFTHDTPAAAPVPGLSPG